MQTINKVLIVEDEEILAANIMTHVQRQGWEARIATNGKQAVAPLGDFVPQVILLDYHLPDMNGFQILEAFCKRYGPCPCVLMTGHPTEHILADAERHGIGNILCKPFGLAEMESILSHALDDAQDQPTAAAFTPERRHTERRRNIASRIFNGLCLADGSWLGNDRRTQNRRH